MPNWKLTDAGVVEDAEGASAGAFNPSDHTIDDVKKYVADHPDEVQRIYDAEVEGKNRTTLVDWLTAG